MEKTGFHLKKKKNKKQKGEEKKGILFESQQALKVLVYSRVGNDSARVLTGKGKN